jgi:hypothetical protein
MWWLGGAAVWLVGACAVALLLGAVLRRGCAAVADDPPPGPRPARERVRVPALRPAASSPSTPPHGLRSQGYLSCAGSVRPRS